MVRTAYAIAISSLFCVFMGCNSGPSIETHSYKLHRRSTEEPIIQAILADQQSKYSKSAFAETVSEYGGTLKVIEVTPDGVAIVRTTPKGHAAIERELKKIEK